MFAETGEYGSVLGSWLDQNAMRLCHQRFTKSHDFGETAGLGENSGVTRMTPLSTCGEML